MVCEYSEVEPGGLWSVSMMIDFPIMHFYGSSQALVSSRVSFSFCAYIDSMVVLALEMNETGF